MRETERERERERDGEGWREGEKVRERGGGREGDKNTTFYLQTVSASVRLWMVHLQHWAQLGTD